MQARTTSSCSVRVARVKHCGARTSIPKRCASICSTPLPCANTPHNPNACVKSLRRTQRKSRSSSTKSRNSPDLLAVVHLLIEHKSNQQYILTGSSARTLRRHGVNLLGGRAAEKNLHPYTAAELGSQFTLAKALQQGMLPVVWAAHDPQAILQAYNGLYLREEVQMEGLVRNIGTFARFLEAMSFAHGSVLNLAAVSRDCQVNRKTAEGYMQILEDLLLGFRLSVFSKRAKREVASHPKFYFFDAGVFRANRPTGPLDSAAELDGAALEGLVAQHLRAWCEYSSGRHELHYWQTRSQVEVDFIVYGESGLFAVEVKNATEFALRIYAP